MKKSVVVLPTRAPQLFLSAKCNEGLYANESTTALIIADESTYEIACISVFQYVTP